MERGMIYDFSKYICGVTGLTCCGCSLFCEHRKRIVAMVRDEEWRRDKDDTTG